MRMQTLCAWALLVTCALTGEHASAADNPRPRYIALGQGTNWVAFDIVSRKAERLTLPAGIKPTDLTLSEDATVVVFTADTKNNREARLYAWDRNPQHPPREIGEPRGYYADPVITRDRKWVYFAHNTSGRGTPLDHTNRAFAQMYRVQLDGSGFEALTTENGCHFAPTLRVQDSVAYVHASCGTRERAIAILDLSTKRARRLVTVTKTMDELELSPDGKRALFSATGNDLISIQEVDLKTGQIRKLTEFARESKRARPHYGNRPGEVFFIRRNAVWVLTPRKVQQLFPLKEVAP